MQDRVRVARLSFAHCVRLCCSLQSAVEGCSEPAGVEIPRGVPLSVFAGQHHQQLVMVEVIRPRGPSAAGSALGHVALGATLYTPGDKRGAAVTPFSMEVSPH